MTQQIAKPFHEGEQQAQHRAGVGDVSQWASGFVRDYLPEQHRAFHTSLPFLILAGEDPSGRVWTTLIEGDDGFITSPDPKRLTLRTAIDPTDPLADRIEMGGDVGGIGIELATRRRNRFSGRVKSGADGIIIKMRQTFGNCPQYIHARSWKRVPRASKAKPKMTNHLTSTQIAKINEADTVFIGSGHQGEERAASNGYDASHRGGAPGFIQVKSSREIRIPDYAGNNFFNTIGNILSNPRVGLLFVDFETGGLLHLTGRAQVDWSPEKAHDPDALRMLNIKVDSVLERPDALLLRWQKLDGRSRKLRLVRREAESQNITSFYLASADGHSLDQFQPGQHLPISLQIPGRTGQVERSYSLSGPSSDTSQYRLSIKREDDGLVSRFLHDYLNEGDILESRPPAGDFLIPRGDGPLVLASAGVGLTPMIAMLHMLADSKRPIWFVHGARSGRDHALKREVSDLVAQHGNLQKRIFYSRSEQCDLPGSDFDVAGRITPPDLVKLAEGADTDYLLCGPNKFLADVRSGLERLGTPPERIHFETFGPSSSGQ